MQHTTRTKDMRPAITPVAQALISAHAAKAIKVTGSRFDVIHGEMLRMTYPLYGHDNREMIGRTVLDRLDTL